jgi:hypothetical protein
MIAAFGSEQSKLFDHIEFVVIILVSRFSRLVFCKLVFAAPPSHPNTKTGCRLAAYDLNLA